MADATDDPLLAAVTKLRVARAAEAEAFASCDAAERVWRDCRRTHDAAQHAVTAAIREVDRLRLSPVHALPKAA